MTVRREAMYEQGGSTCQETVWVWLAWNWPPALGPAAVGAVEWRVTWAKEACGSGDVQACDRWRSGWPVPRRGLVGLGSVVGRVAARPSAWWPKGTPADGSDGGR